MYSSSYLYGTLIATAEYAVWHLYTHEMQKICPQPISC